MVATKMRELNTRILNRLLPLTTQLTKRSISSPCDRRRGAWATGEFLIATYKWMFQRTELWLQKSNLSMLLITRGGNHDVWYVLREWRFKKNKDLPSIRVACQNGPNLCMGFNKQNLSPASTDLYTKLGKLSCCIAETRSGQFCKLKSGW